MIASESDSPPGPPLRWKSPGSSTKRAPSMCSARYRPERRWRQDRPPRLITSVGAEIAGSAARTSSSVLARRMSRTPVGVLALRS